MLQWHFSSEASSCPYAHFVAMALPRTPHQLLLQERPHSQLKHVHYLGGVHRTSFLLDKADPFASLGGQTLVAFTTLVRFATSQQACSLPVLDQRKIAETGTSAVKTV